MHASAHGEGHGDDDQELQRRVVANAHVAAGSSDPSYLEYPWDPPEWTEARRDYLLTSPVEADRDGNLVLSDAPGLGFEVDEAAVKRTKVDGVVKSNN